MSFLELPFRASSLDDSNIQEFNIQKEFEKGKGFLYKGAEYVHHSNLSYHETALYRLNRKQKVFIFSIFFIAIIGFIINWHFTATLIIAVITIMYFLDLLFNLYLIIQSFSKEPELHIKEEDIVKLKNKDLPTYTILCPLYKEWPVIPQFINAMDKLHYPKDKLQIMFLLEEDDTESIEHVRDLHLPAHFTYVVVPHSKPKTKPKACNYGIKRASGEYIVIYDAEDVPDPDQLKKAYLAFQASDSHVVCIQAKLGFYNPHHNLLTRAFTAEYSLWFDLVLTGLQSIQAPIPLGGTSNHFRRQDIIDLGGWDAFNVTEDCDLGMRIAKKGYKTAIVDSITLEEANSGIFNWYKQRTRWIKGYIQTYFVHTRNLGDFPSTWRQPTSITFQLVVGGKVFSMLINPLLWLLTASYFLFRAHIGVFIEGFFPPAILYMGVVCFVFGNFMYMYYYMIGCAKRGHEELIKYVYFVPIYWLGMSASAWAAASEMLYKPHYWFKTTHGLHLKNQRAVEQSQQLISQQTLSYAT